MASGTKHTFGKSLLALCGLPLLFAAAAVAAQTQREYADSNTVFNWAEQQFPDYFQPENAATQSISGYLARYYADTDTWLGSYDGEVYVVGNPFAEMEPSDSVIKPVGTLSDFLSLARNDSSLVINEIVAKAEDGGSDWFEVYATGQNPVDLSEYSVVDDEADREPQSLPDITLQPGEFLVIYATDEALEDATAYSVGFKLGSSDSIGLYKNGVLVDYIEWQDGDAASGFSFGRYPDADTGSGQTLAPTPGAANQVSADTTVTDGAATASIALNGTSIATDGDGVVAENGVLTITAAGTYTLSGTLTDGQIVVDTADLSGVNLVFNGVDISSSTSAPLFVRSAENVTITLVDGTDNRLTDGSTYLYSSADEDEPDAALFSKADLTINGNGSLTVNANYNDGIKSKDGLVIRSGNLTVNAADDGIQGKDYLYIIAGNITVNAGGDGLKSSNDEDSTLGYVSIAGGALNITSGSDAIQGETNVAIADGTFTLRAGGGSDATIGGDDSAKGIKAGVGVAIDGGTFAVDSANDSIHANESVVINGGDYTLASGDDGIHADSTVEINQGTITISKSYEGIEASTITINGGTLHVDASDDGINVAGGNDGSGPGNFMSGGNNYLYINGGYIVVDADGDGLDANGSIAMTGGVVMVNGPTDNSNGAIDYDGTFNISGGYLVASGSSGMAQTASQSSSQYAILVGFDTSIAAGTLIHIENDSGEEIVTFAPTKTSRSLAFSSSALSMGSTYRIYYGGTSTGTPTDGLYDGGTYSDGTLYNSFTISSMVTTINIQPMGGGFPQFPGR